MLFEIGMIPTGAICQMCEKSSTRFIRMSTSGNRSLAVCYDCGVLLGAACLRAEIQKEGKS